MLKKIDPAEELKLKALLFGEQGTGKSYTAYAWASILAKGKRFAVLDTEGKRSLIYKNNFSFDAFDLTVSHAPKAYIEAVEELAAGGYDVIVIDSLSDAWSSDLGGCVMKQAALVESGKCKVAQLAWAKVKRDWNGLIRVLRSTDAHILCTAKIGDEIDKATNKPIGKKPIMEKDTKYLFDVVLRMENSGRAHIEKLMLDEEQIGRTMERPDKVHFNKLMSYVNGPAPKKEVKIQ